MDTSVLDPQIEGLPAGFTVKPLAPAAAPVDGLPPGYTIKPIGEPKPPVPPTPQAAAPAARPTPPTPPQSWLGRAVDEFKAATGVRMPGDRGDLSDIPAPMPKTAPPTPYVPTPQEAADLPPVEKPAGGIFGEMDAQQRQINQATSPMGGVAPLPIGIPEKPAKPSQGDVLRQERMAEAGHGSEFAQKPEPPAPKNLQEQLDQQRAAIGAEAVPGAGPQLVTAKPPSMPTLQPKEQTAPGMVGKAWDWALDLPTGVGGAQRTFRDAFRTAATGLTGDGQGQGQGAKDFNEQMLPHVVNLLDQLDAKYGPKPVDPEQHKKDLMAQGVSEADAEKFKNLGAATTDPLRDVIDAYKAADPNRIAQIQDRSASAQNIIRGIGAGGRQVADGLSTPFNASLLYVLSEESIPRAVRMLTDMKFTYDQARASVEEFQRGYQAYKKGDIVTATQAFTAWPVDALFAFLTGRHLLHDTSGAVRDLSETKGGQAVDAWATRQLEQHAGKPTQAGVEDYIAQQAATRARDAAAPDSIVKREAGQPADVPATPEEKPVLHGSNDVEELRASAERQAPALGDAAKNAAEAVPGAKLEAVRDSKDTDRIEDKAGRQGVEPSQIGDIAAAKIIVPDQAAAEKVLSQLNEEMPVESVNGSVNGEPGKNNVRQVQAIVDLGAPAGEPVKKAEVLIQTPEMAKAAADTHDDYRKAQELRAGGDEAGAKALEDQIAAQHEAAEQAARERQGGSDAIRQPGEQGAGPAGAQPQGAASAGKEGVEPKYKFASTQHNIADDSEAGKALTAARGKVAYEDIAGDGRDIDGNHVTVRYGLKHDLTPEMRAFIESQAPFDATLGATESFKPSENSDGAAPIIAPIESPELTRLNAEIEKHGDFEKSDFPDYKPHATVAYVKPEAAGKYTGDKSTIGKKFRVDSIAVTDRNGNATEIPLRGAAEPEKQGRPVLSDSSEQTQLGNPPPEDKVERVPVDQIQLDPKRFQYKMNTDQSGVTNLLKGRKWNENLAGRINVWRDPDDGKLYVVNGHHRFQLAQENGVKDVKVDYIQAPTAQEARAIGALQNIAEGRGSAMDAAKFFRDSGYTPDKLDDLGISMGEATAANGLALSKLDPSIFEKVVNGQLRQGRAIAIGNASADPADQEALLKLIEKAETKGKRVTDDVVDELARMVKGSGQHTETQTNLFGTQEMTRNLALEKADISSHIREKIGQERRTFQSVADSGKAAQLSTKVKGQVLKPEQNAEIARQAQMAQELYDRLSTRAGTIDDILNRAAKELAEGGKPSDVRQRAYDDIRAELSKTVSGATGPDNRGVQAAPQKERGPGQPPIPPERRAQGGAEPEAGTAGTERGTPRATGPADLKAPKPPREPIFNEGRQATSIEVRDADGNWRRGTLDYYNGGVNGQPRRGRVTLDDGTKMNNVPDEAMRLAEGARPVKVANREVKPITHAPGEADVIERTKANADKLVTDYLEKNTDEHGVPTIATDAAKELYPEFKADPVNNDRDVAAGAKAVRNWALDHALAQPVDPSRPDVLITTASPGSGKTTGQALGGDRPGIGMKIEAISDADKGFNEILRRVIASGRRPVVEWIYVDSPAKTVDRMFRRAIGHDGRTGIGRTVQLAYMADAYYQVPRVIERAMEKFGDQADYHLIDNSGKPGEATASADMAGYIEKAKKMTYNQIKEEMDAQVEQLRSEGLFDSERGRDSFKAAHASDEGTAQKQPPGERASSVQEGGQRPQHEPQAAGSLLTPEKQLEQERQANDGRTSERKTALQAAADRSVRENAESHQSKVVDFKGRKAVVLDPDGEGVWHRVFSKIKAAGGANPLGAGESWRGVRLDRSGVNVAVAYLKGAIEDLRVMGTVTEKAEAGFNRMVDALKEARDSKGGAVVLRGDYRADTQREEAHHQWWQEHDLDKSDALVDVSRRPDFTETVQKLRGMGYEDAGPKTVAAEILGKAMAGDPDLDITDAERESLVREFLSAAVQERGPRILDNLPDTDPRLKDVIDEVKKQYGEHDEQGAREGARQTLREQTGQAGAAGREGSAGSRQRDQERPGQPGGERVQPGDEEKPPSKAELEAAGQASMFQRRAPRPPIRPEDSFALPGMEHVDRERQAELGLADADRMTDKLREPGKDISEAAGRMERESPLFSGTPASGMNNLFGQATLFDSSGENPTLFQRDTTPKAGDLLVNLPVDISKGDKLAGDEEGWKQIWANYAEQYSPEYVKKLWGYAKEGMDKPFWTSGGRMILSPEKDGSWAVRLAETVSDQREKGIATAMYNKAIEYAKAKGATELTSDPEGGSKDSVAGIWKKLGAVETPGVGEKPGAGPRWRLDLSKIPDSKPAGESPYKGESVPLFQKAKGGDEGPVARSVRDLVDEMKAAPAKGKGTMLDRVASWTKDTIEESVDRSQGAITKIPDALEGAWAWSKATTAALIHDYMHPLEQTDWKRAAGQMQLAEAESAQRLYDLAREIKKTVPKELDRIAISHFMEAGGDDRKLRTWLLGAKELAIKSQNDPLLSRQRKAYLRDAVGHYEQATKLTPEQKALAGRLRQHFDDMLDIAQEHGIIDYGYRNYVMHLYDRDEAARLLNEVDTNELNPNPGFIKKRFYDTLFTAEQSGMTPKSKDIGYLLTAYDKSLNQAIASRNFMRSMLDAKAPDGRPIAAIRARNGWVTVDPEKGLQVLNQRPRPASLDGYEAIDRPQLRNFLFKPTTADLEGYDPKLFEDNPEGLAFKGDLMIHPKYVAQITDMLTPSWFERGQSWPQKIGRGVQAVSGAAKELMTAAAPFHMVQLGVHGMEHLVNPFKLPELDLSGKSEDSKIQRLLASHGLSLVNYDAEGLFGTKALHGIAEHIPFVNKGMDSIQAFSHWQFQDYIPRLKMQMALDAFKRNSKLYGKQLDTEQIAELTSKESNAAFGNLNTMFDSVPRTKTFKSLLKLATFAPDFLESRIRFMGQAFTKYGGEQRAALLRGALAMYIAARVGNYMLNDKDPKWDPEHAFSLVIGGKSYAMRTVQGDLLHAIDDPRGFIYNRLNPLTTRPIVEFLSGRDQMGREKTVGDQVKDLAKAVLPFGIQKIIQTPDESLLNSVLTSAGINARNDRTQTEEEVHRLYLKSIPSAPQDEEQQAESRKLRKLEDGIRDGSKIPAEVWDLVDKGEISPREAGRTVERGQQSRLQIEFKALHLKDAVKVYEKLQAESKEPKIYPHVALELSELRPEMEHKATSSIADLPEADREAMANKLDALLSEPLPQQK